MLVPLILSGGSGSRLWPLSRSLYPKQFLALVGDETLFQQTLRRLDWAGIDAPIIVANEQHRFIVAEQAQAVGVKAQHILLEPFGRNTAPAVALGAMKLLGEGRDDLLLVLPADHVIKDVERFHQVLQQASTAAEQGELALFGIPAEAPETGYGYIRAARRASRDLPDGILPVERFVEKPDLATARNFVREGGYFWNSGMFMFRCSRYLEELEAHAPDIYAACLDTLKHSQADLDFIRIDAGRFAACPEDSIDYAVMEKTGRACVVPLQAGWSDVGSWSSLWDIQEKDEQGNALNGDVMLADSRDNLVRSSGQLVALLGVENLVVVATRDGVLVADKNRVQDIKQLVNRMSKEGREIVDTHCRVLRPWGDYESLDVGDRFQVKRITVKPKASLSLQKHHHRAEHWIVVSGTAEVTCGDRKFMLFENQSTYIPIATLHRLSNPGKIPLEIIEVQSGGYLGEDDIERFDDNYGRLSDAGGKDAEKA